MNFKNIFLVLMLLTFFNSNIFSQEKDKVRCVVIDAGHGGEDPGTVGKRVKEKDVNLDVALRLGKLISSNYEDVKVIYTRKTDVSVDLYKRARIANENHADLFISIHCNAAENKSARGVETFVMGLHKSEASLAVAKKENAAILKEKNYENNYEGFNPDSPEANVIFSLYTSAYLKNSTSLAAKVQNNLVQNTNFLNRKVQQAGFWVLYKVAMPSILIELGFLSNYEEETIIIQDATKRVMSESIYNAFVDYKNLVEGTNKKGIEIIPIYKQVPPNQHPEPQLTNQDSIVVQDKSVVDTNAKDQVKFRIQVYATPDNLPLSDNKFKALKQVKRYYENNWWKYTSGDEVSFDSAQDLLKEVKQKGFPDAFIVAFLNEEKIPIDQAKTLVKKN